MALNLMSQYLAWMVWDSRRINYFFIEFKLHKHGMNEVKKLSSAFMQHNIKVKKNNKKIIATGD